jgi:phage shock protein PspC (stress-responsive transcriptional regulator)
MKLSASQESLIKRYLKEVDVAMGAQTDASVRNRALTRTRALIERELMRSKINDDADVLAALRRLGAPAKQAEIFGRSEPKPTKKLRLSQEESIWLGVAANVARRMELEPWMARAIFFLLGVATGPVAIVAYLGAYVSLHLSSEEGLPPVYYGRLLLRTTAAFAAATALHLAGRYALQGIHLAHNHFLKSPVPLLDDWGWLEIHQGRLFFLALACTLPLSVLSATPLKYQWDHSLKRIVQALLALYGIVLSFGVASVLVGIILDFVRELS